MNIQHKNISKTSLALMDSSLKWEHRKRLLFQVVVEGGEDGDEVLKSILDAAGVSHGQALQNEKLKELTELIDELQKPPLRGATFVGMIETSNSIRRAHVLLQDGEDAYPVVPSTELQQQLRCGDRVLLESQGRAILGRDPAGDCPVGEEARLDRRIDSTRVEVCLREFDHHVYSTSAKLSEKLDTGEVEPGAKVLVCARRAMAFDVVPAADTLSHYWYLAREPVPEVAVERDIGCPPLFIEELTEHVRMELGAPESGRRYRLRRAQTKLLTGASGSGKTLSIHGFWRRMYELMSEITGVPISQLPPRVLRLRMPKVLSKWLGESDKRLDRFFDEVEQLADQPFVTPDGTSHELPVLAICEEIEGLARARGDGDPIYDRIQTTALERLDTNCQKLKNRLVIFLFTTNLPALLDPAFLRRAGGTIEQFGRLSRRAFLAVLDKHLRDLPFRSDYGDQREAERRVVREVTDWLFSPNGHDPGLIQIMFVGSATPVVKYRRDLLTGALVDRAVQQAATEACRAEQLGSDEPGLTAEMVIASLDRQLLSLAEQLTPQNVAHYVTLPDGVRVGDVRRIEQPRVLPYNLQRVS